VHERQQTTHATRLLLKKKGQGDIPLVCHPPWGREGGTLIASLKKIQKWVDKGTLYLPVCFKKGSRVWFMKFTGIEIQQR
jgi:hypothetical protein